MTETENLNIEEQDNLPEDKNRDFYRPFTFFAFCSIECSCLIQF